MQIKAKPFLKYTLTPQLMPRIKGLFFSGFSYVAFFMAQTYRAVRLLPDGHPYLSPANMGRFGIRHVIVEAGNALEFKKENIDQIAIYGLTILGLILMVSQLLMLLAAGFVDVAYAGSLLYPSSSPLLFFTYFRTPAATNELAFVLLDRVFGLPGTGGPGTSFFADAAGGYSCVVQGIACFELGQSSRVLTPDNTIYTDYARGASHVMTFPWPYHEALRGMLQFYSVGLLVIGVFIFLYFAFAIAAETAQTGTAFGRRFNHIWAPLRIVIAMGLLVPITYGLNPAQWILMYAAKWGSSFATNGWIIYNNAITAEETLLGPRDTLVARPEAPPVNTLMEFGSILATCYESYNRVYHARTGRAQFDLEAWLINPQDVTLQPINLETTTFAEAVQYFNRGTMHIRFGELRGDYHQAWDGRVAPYCGELTLDMPYIPENLAVGVSSGVSPGATEPGSIYVEFRWYSMIQDIWCMASGECGASVFGGANFRDDIGIPMTNRHIAYGNDANALLPPSVMLATLRDTYQTYVENTITLGVMYQQDSQEWLEQLTELGWGGAAIWYNKIAQLNGGLITAIYSMPTIKNYPYVMEKVRKERAASDDGVSGETAHRTYRGTDNPMDLDDVNEDQVAKALYETQALWRDNYFEEPREGNILIDMINMIFGTEGLFNITENEAQDIHPLAQLAAIGRSIIESAIRNLGYSVAAGFSGGVANLFQQNQIGSFTGATAGFFFQVAMIGLSVGFVLFYIIPFLPFIYFFFAVGGWVKAIFEAMVGVPLWALAHIRIDGEGMPPDAAMGGYYLILEIFLRPILIIFGFIASITIFGAQVRILHEIWWLVVSSVSGFEHDAAAAVPANATGSIQFLRSAVDEFFYTVMYAIICYMMAMGSFKLIDQIPNHLLRWMGASVSTFGNDQDPAENLVRNAFIGTNMISSPLRQAAGGMKQAASSGTEAVGELFGRSSRGR